MQNSLLLSHTIYILEKLVVCLSLLMIEWFLVPAPELQIMCPLSLSSKTHSLSTFLKTRMQCSWFSLQIVLITFRHVKSSFFHPFSFLWIPPLSLPPQSHSPLVLNSISSFLSGSHTILSFQLWYSPPHLWVLSLLLSASYTILPHYFCSMSLSF